MQLTSAPLFRWASAMRLCGFFLAATVSTTAIAGEWSFSGETRARFETLDGQFRANGQGGDQILASRTLLAATYTHDAIAIGVEVQDSRGWLDDQGSAVSTSVINAFDLLQLYMRTELPVGWGDAGSSLAIGRQTLNIGSRRQIERVEFANVIFNYTGLYWSGAGPASSRWHALAVVPLERLPSDAESLIDNRIEADQEAWQSRIYGLHWEGWRPWSTDIAVDFYLYALDEDDTADVPTPNRRYLTPGLRLLRKPTAQRLDFEVEAAWRFGERRETSAAADVRDLEVDASMLYAVLGYTFDHPVQPRLAAQYYYASGDRDPGDDRFDQYERLFGSRRTDLGHTGLFGPLTPANLSAPGLRLEFKPSERLDGRLVWSRARLESATDAWVIARRRDASGQSGSQIGDLFDARVRYWVVPERWQVEVGGSWLEFGDFARTAPPVASEQQRTLFGYLQVLYQFD